MGDTPKSREKICGRQRIIFDLAFVKTYPYCLGKKNLKSKCLNLAIGSSDGREVNFTWLL
ncbi:MAG: hypothetical protein DMF61_11355 [Blastocatellia bacterium AA13]|nr:MAG: hypothetical protein DMF61_11355 [Blastocatellia bacterium AA13]